MAENTSCYKHRQDHTDGGKNSQPASISSLIRQSLCSRMPQRVVLANKQKESILVSFPPEGKDDSNQLPDLRLLEQLNKEHEPT